MQFILRVMIINAVISVNTALMGVLCLIKNIQFILHVVIINAVISVNTALMGVL